LYITRYTFGENKCSEKIYFVSYLYYTYISAVETHIIINQKFTYYIQFIVSKTGWVIPNLL